MKSQFTSVIASLLFQILPTHAWTATQYQDITVALDTNAPGLTVTFTDTTIVTPTRPVTPISTATAIDDLDSDLTYINIYLSGTNLPLSTTASFNPSTFTQKTLTTPTVTSVFFAPATITQPPACTKTTFSYTTNISIDPPTVLLAAPNSLPVTSSTTFVTTTFYTNADGQTTSSSSWTEEDFYLPTGLTVPTLSSEDQVMLGLCQDPRGCFNGQGAGCTTAGKGSGASAATGTSAPAGTSTTTKESAAKVLPNAREVTWTLCGVVGAVVLIVGHGIV